MQDTSWAREPLGGESSGTDFCRMYKKLGNEKSEIKQPKAFLNGDTALPGDLLTVLFGWLFMYISMWRIQRNQQWLLWER